MKTSISIIFLSFLFLRVSAQQQEIIKLLNNALQKEMDVRDTMMKSTVTTMVKPYVIENDTLKAELYLKDNTGGVDTYFSGQQAALKDVVFIVNEDTETWLTTAGYKTKKQLKRYHKPTTAGEIEASSYLFNLHLYHTTPNFRKQLCRAFNKAGYQVKLID